MTVLVLGGSRSGKSDFAQQLALALANGGRHYYVATMIPGDSEDYARIRSHLARREGMGFETIECGRNLISCLDRADKDAVFLLDSVTTLLTNELFPREKHYAQDEDAALRCKEHLLRFAGSVGSAVLVADDLFCDAVRYDAATDAFRRHLGGICRALAQRCDTVLEMAGGSLRIHKGECPI